MAKHGRRKAWKTQRALLCELPGLGKPGALERRAYPPGQHGQGRRKFSEYGVRLREKQKMLHHYGLREEQFRRFIRTAKAAPSKDWMSTLVGMLERRVDNLVFRLGFAPSIPAARQLVRHGKVLVDGKRLDISSAIVNPGSTITLTPDAYRGVVYQTSIQSPRLLLADWLEHEREGDFVKGRLKSIPPSDAVPFEFAGRWVIELYSGT
jgi:small subunit ribosomal protein S4